MARTVGCPHTASSPARWLLRAGSWRERTDDAGGVQLRRDGSVAEALACVEVEDASDHRRRDRVGLELAQHRPPVAWQGSGAPRRCPRACSRRVASAPQWTRTPSISRQRAMSMSRYPRARRARRLSVGRSRHAHGSAVPFVRPESPNNTRPRSSPIGSGPYGRKLGPALAAEHHRDEQHHTGIGVVRSLQPAPAACGERTVATVEAAPSPTTCPSASSSHRSRRTVHRHDGRDRSVPARPARRGCAG